MSTFRAIAVPMLCATGLSAQASLTQLYDPSAMSTTFVNDFETAVDLGPVTFNPGTAIGGADAWSDGVTSSGFYGLLGPDDLGPITATLSSGYHAVGMYFGNDDLCCSQGFSPTLSVYAGATLLGSVSVVANMNDYADQFIGVSSTIAFDRVSISYGGESLYVFIDDFRIGSAVPEPSSSALLALGLGAIAWGARRRKA